MPPLLAPLRARLRRLRLVQPLARRDYALLTAGAVVSLLGDGFFSVALDWLVSTGLVPVSFALTGPVAAALGPGQTMIGAGLAGAVLMGALLFVPGVRDPERQPARKTDELGRLRA